MCTMHHHNSGMVEIAQGCLFRRRHEAGHSGVGSRLWYTSRVFQALKDNAVRALMASVRDSWLIVKDTGWRCTGRIRVSVTRSLMINRRPCSVNWHIFTQSSRCSFGKRVKIWSVEVSECILNWLRDGADGLELHFQSRGGMKKVTEKI